MACQGVFCGKTGDGIWHKIPFMNTTTGSNSSANETSNQPGLDAGQGVDATVTSIERVFDGGAERSKGQTTWQTGTETGSRSSARPRTGPSSPSLKRRGRGSLGVLMPTLLPSRPTFTGRGTSDVGSLTHGLIGSHVQSLTAREATVVVPGDLLARMYAVAYAVIDANPNATRVLATEAASLAYLYLTEFPPAGSWRLLGVEFDTGDGPVDLAWVNDRTGDVFFDEVKTSRVSNGRQPSPTWVAQAHRYSMAGSAQFGEAFLGTRLVPLMAANTTRLVRSLKPVVLLDPTVVEPLRLAASDGRTQ
ncbi:hypothetical protein Pve01_80240 [Planomonospora venezuelensis]|nr:hypothetical protein Pve01_80240 [Planomonospora venezuelensis]